MDAKTSRIERKFDTKWAQIGHDRDQGQSLPSPLISELTPQIKYETVTMPQKALIAMSAGVGSFQSKIWEMRFMCNVA